MKRGIIRLLILFAFFVFGFVTSSSYISALQEGSCVNIDLNDISPSSIKVGDEFTMGFVLDNCGQVIPENISFELIKVSPYVEVKEPLNISIGKMGYSNSNRFILYHMKVKEDASPGEYLFNYKLIYGNSASYFSKEGNFTVDVIGDTAELSIASVKTSPILPVKGEMVELTMRIENTGKGTAKSIKIYAEHPFDGIKQTFLGSLKENEDGPVVFTFIPDKVGEFNFPVTISYSDDFGEKEIKTRISLNIMKPKSNLGVISLVIIILIAVVLGFRYYIKKNKSKDEIIHKLLTENNKDKKK